MDNATAALARMNMILHDNATAEIWQDNTLAAPRWKNPDGGLKTFDFAVANPTFSFKSWSNGVKLGKDGEKDKDQDEFQRFGYGLPPDKNGDYAFLLHILKSLKSTGTAAVILPHGVLFRGMLRRGFARSWCVRAILRGLSGYLRTCFMERGFRLVSSSSIRRICTSARGSLWWMPVRDLSKMGIRIGCGVRIFTRSLMCSIGKSSYPATAGW